MSSSNQIIGEWVSCVSSKTGCGYYYKNSTKESLWKDDSLPWGWGWGKSNEKGPKFYQNLLTGERLATVPQSAAILEDNDTAPTAKRARVSESAGAPPVALPSQIPLEKPTSGTNLPRLPDMTKEELGSGLASWPEVAPPCLMGAGRRREGGEIGMVAPSGAPASLLMEEPFFNSHHSFILHQLMQRALVLHSTWQTGRQKFLIAQAERARVDSSDIPADKEEWGEDGDGDGGGGSGFGMGVSASEAHALDKLVILDIGSGKGNSTEFFLKHSANALGGQQIYAIDLWDKSASFYAQQLQYYGNEELAKVWAMNNESCCESSTSSVNSTSTHHHLHHHHHHHHAEKSMLSEHFAARFWDCKNDSTIIPCTFPASYAIQYLVQYLHLRPELVYIDADLSETGLSDILTLVWEKWMEPEVLANPSLSRNRPPTPPLVAGAGWALSEGVRLAVSAFASKHGLPLHVEGGSVWTFSVEAIRETRNGEGSAILHAPSSSASATLIGVTSMDAEAEVMAARQLWQTEVFSVLEAHTSTVADLTRAIGSHGRRAAAGTGGGGAEMSVPGSGSNAEDKFAGIPWVDEFGDDKRHLTPLMRAAKAGRVDFVEALIDHHGACVNIQAARSSFTALHTATYAGKEGVVAALLARGADPTLLNKYGESSIKVGEMRKNRKVLELLLAATREKAGTGK